MFTLDRETLLTPQLVIRFIQRHLSECSRLQKLADYYNGRHGIEDRSKRSMLANNRVVCNHAKYISDLSTGYLLGNPVSYAGAHLEQLLDWYRKAEIPVRDMDIGKDCSVFGRGYELIYLSAEESPAPRSAVFDPRNAFVVYDDTVEHLPLFGCCYYPLFQEDGILYGYACCYYTKSTAYHCRISTGFSLEGEAQEQPHPFGAVPLIEYSNNEEQQGDFEQVITLIDAYNMLQSDRVNDKQQFVEAILLLQGATLGDDDKEKSETYQSIRKYGMMEIDPDAKASWLTRTFDESSVEILRRSLEQDIHKFSGVPCMTDENFSGNASGVAMRYKLLGFEQVTKIKERYFTDGLKKRLRLFANIMAAKGMPKIDPDAVEITFTRSLPVNEPELAQVVSTLNGIVSEETLLGLLPFVKDPAGEQKKLKAEQQENIRNQQQMFGMTLNEPPQEQDDETQ